MSPDTSVPHKERLAPRALTLMYLGFAGEAFKDEAQLSMRTGERATVGRYELRFDGIRQHSDAQKQMATATLSVFSADGVRLAGRVAGPGALRCRQPGCASVRRRRSRHAAPTCGTLPECVAPTHELRLPMCSCGR